MPRSRATLINATAMLVAVVGIITQIAGGVDYPTVPPGPILLAVAAGLVLLVHRFWARVVGVVVPLFLTVGGLIAPTGRDNLTDPENTATFLGTALQLAAVVVALIAGVVALRSNKATAYEEG